MTNSTYPVAFQLYSARNFPPISAQLPILKDLGYDAVEPWPEAYLNNTTAFRNLLEDAELSCFGIHAPLHGLNEDLNRYVEVAESLGATFLIAPFVPAEERGASPEFWVGIGRTLRRVAERAKSFGISVLWHNHDFEYLRLADGTLPIDRIFEGADNEVGLEIDCGWVVRAGMDLSAEFVRHGERIRAIHFKDVRPVGITREDGWAAVGDGIIEWDKLAPLVRKSNAEHIVVEHDNPDNWLCVAERSIRKIKEIGLH